MDVATPLSEVSCGSKLHVEYIAREMVGRGLSRALSSVDVPSYWLCVRIMPLSMSASDLSSPPCPTLTRDRLVVEGTHTLSTHPSGSGMSTVYQTRPPIIGSFPSKIHEPRTQSGLVRRRDKHEVQY